MFKFHEKSMHKVYIKIWEMVENLLFLESEHVGMGECSPKIYFLYYVW